MDNLDRFARAFFGDGNSLRYDDIRDGKLPPQHMKELQPWWDDLNNGVDPLILPRGFAGHTTWYAVARTPRTFRQLRESLVAFFGESWSDYTGQPTPMDPADPVERAITAQFGQWSIRLTVPKQFRAEIRNNLRLRRDLLSEAPTRPPEVVRPVGRIMRDFEEALRLRDGGLISESLEEILQTGELDARSILFLRVLGFDALRDYESVLAADVDSLASVRRPRRVSQALISAIYDSELSSFEHSEDPTGAVDHFRVQLKDRLRSVAADPSSVRRSSRSWYLLASLCLDEKHRPAREDAVLRLGSVDLSDWEASLVDLLPDGREPRIEEIVPDALGQAQELLAAKQLHDAFAVARNAAASADRLELLINAAWAIDSLEAAAVALEEVESATAAIRTECLERAGIAKTVKFMRANSATESAPATSIPSSWAELFQAMSETAARAGLVGVAERGMDEWPLADSTADHISQLANFFITDLAPWGEELRAQTLPFFLGALGRIDPVPYGFRDLLDAVLLFILTEEAPASGYFGTVCSAIDARIGVGITETHYRSMLVDVQAQISTHLSPKNLHQVIDLVDALLEASAPDKSARTALFGQVTSQASAFAHRVERPTRLLLKKLSEEVGTPLLAPLMPGILAPDEDNLSARLRDKVISLYSLTTGVTRRVSEMLIEAGAGQVKTFDNKGGTPPLRAAAQNSDIFVIAWASATHAATGFIEANLGDSVTLLRPAGKGSGSMWNAIVEWAEGGAG